MTRLPRLAVYVFIFILQLILNFLFNAYKNFCFVPAQTSQAVDSSSDDDEDNLVSLRTIMNETKTNKLWRHHYERYYSKWLPRKKLGLKMLEIGADTGESLATWAHYFSSPELIVGLAYGRRAANVQDKVKEEFNFVNGDKVKVVWGDQSKNETMQELCQHGPFDFIIDDGSHVPQHTIYSFVHLFPCLKPGGFYVIEDIETSYWDQNPSIYGYKFERPGIGSSPRASAIEKLMQVINVLNRYTVCYENLSVLPGDHDICSMTWGSNLVKIDKCTAEEKKDHSQCSFGGAIDKARIQQWMEEAQSTNIPF